MKRTKAKGAAAVLDGAAPAEPSNGNGAHLQNGASPDLSPDLNLILASLQRMQEGDFSARLPGTWTGLHGKIADTFNDIVSANEQMASELKRIGEAVGKKGRIRERTKFRGSKGAWGEMEGSVNTL